MNSTKSAAKVRCQRCYELLGDQSMHGVCASCWRAWMRERRDVTWDTWLCETGVLGMTQYTEH